jgi:hypothetical protein
MYMTDSRMNPEGFCPEDDNTADSGAETFIGLATDAEDAAIHRIDSKFGLSAPKARKVPAPKYVGPARTGRRYLMTVDGPQRLFAPAPVVAPKPAPVVAPVVVPAPKPAPVLASKPAFVPVARPVSTTPGRSTAAPHKALTLTSRPLHPMPRNNRGGRVGTHRNGVRTGAPRW